MKPRATLTFIAVILFAFLYLPLIVIALYSFNSSRYATTWTGFSLKWYTALAHDEVALAALKNSLVLATSSSFISTILGTALGYGMHRSNSPRIATLLHIPICLPDIVQAVSLLLFFTFLQTHLHTFGLGMPAMIIAHATFQIPFVALVVRARAATLDPAWREAALDLGATPAQTFLHVTLPNLRPGILAGALLAFTLSLDDFIVSFFTGGAGSSTLPVLIYASVKRGLSPEINALSTLLILAAVAATILLTAIQKSPTVPLDE
jgi:spermidine/putrescine transport system permease protein